MDYKLYLKNSFLKQTIGSFAANNGNMTCENIQNIAENSVSWYVPKGFVKKNAPVIRSLFEQVDGRTLNRDDILSGKTAIPLVRKDGKVEKAELFQLVKDYYRDEKGKILSDSDVSNMNITKLLDIFMDMIDKM